MSELLTPFERLHQIDSRCRALAAGLPSQKEVAHTWAGIGFRMGSRYYVAPMGEVGEVLPEPRQTQLPGVKPWIRGVANVRGRLLPVIDLCGYFGLELSPLRKQRRLLVVDHRDVFAGLTVDEVFGMQHFPVDGFSELLPHVESSIRPFLHGVFQRERPWLVFSPQTLAAHPDFLRVAM